MITGVTDCVLNINALKVRVEGPKGDLRLGFRKWGFENWEHVGRCTCHSCP